MTREQREKNIAKLEERLAAHLRQLKVTTSAITRSQRKLAAQQRALAIELEIETKARIEAAHSGLSAPRRFR